MLQGTPHLLASMRLAFLGSTFGSRRGSPAGVRPPLPRCCTFCTTLRSTSCDTPAYHDESSMKHIQAARSSVIVYLTACALLLLSSKPHCRLQCC